MPSRTRSRPARCPVPPSCGLKPTVSRACRVPDPGRDAVVGCGWSARRDVRPRRRGDSWSELRVADAACEAPRRPRGYGGCALADLLGGQVTVEFRPCLCWLRSLLRRPTRPRCRCGSRSSRSVWLRCWASSASQLALPCRAGPPRAPNYGTTVGSHIWTSRKRCTSSINGSDFEETKSADHRAGADLSRHLAHIKRTIGAIESKGYEVDLIASKDAAEAGRNCMKEVVVSQAIWMTARIQRSA